MSDISQNPVLVLNRSWQPIAITNLEKIMPKLFSYYKDGDIKAKIVDPANDFMVYSWDEWAEIEPKESEKFIQTPNKRFKIPEIIMMTRYDKIPNSKVVFNKRAVYRRDNYTCLYCGKKLIENKNRSIDHIVALSRGGSKSSFENCVSCCKPCNRRKGSMTPHEAGMTLLYEPFVPKFNIFNNIMNFLPSWESFIHEKVINNI